MTFFDYTSLVHDGFVPDGKTMNQHFYQLDLIVVIAVLTSPLPRDGDSA